jgi:hypothetical protein
VEGVAGEGTGENKVGGEVDCRRMKTRFALILAVAPFIPASNLFFPVGTVIGKDLQGGRVI